MNGNKNDGVSLSRTPEPDGSDRARASFAWSSEVSDEAVSHCCGFPVGGYGV